jgi:hypothetical protein
MQYELPRYIEEEAKVAGPLSMKQFIMLFMGFLVCAALFIFFKTGIAIFLSVIVMTGIGIAAIGKMNGRPLSELILASLKYLWNPKIYVWHRDTPRTEAFFREATRQKQEEKMVIEKKVVTGNTLSEIAHDLDAKDTAA